MRRLVVVAMLALFVGACAPANQERVRDYNEIGVEAFNRGEYRPARDCFQAALNLQPGDPNLVYNVAQCNERIGQVAKAEQLYNECLQRRPNHVECRYALAGLLVRQNRRDDAVRLTENWLAREPRLAGPYAVDGWLWRQYGDLPRAQARLQQALAINPADNFALTELAHVYEEMSRPERAVALYEKALDVKSDQPEVRMRLTALQKQGTGRPRPD